MEKRNDPKRVRGAWIRVCAALLIAAALLAVSGFGAVKMLSTPKTLAVSDATVEAEGSAEPIVSAVSKKGDYVTHEIFFLLGNFAERTKGETVIGRYAVVPVEGKLVAFYFPQRWFESEDVVYDATMALLSGTSYSLDSYIRVTGTLDDLPEDVAAQLYDWFGEYKDWLSQMGLAAENNDYSSILFDEMVVVDRVGPMNQTLAVAFGVAALVCLLYAVYELARILGKGYAPKTVPTVETPADEDAPRADEPAAPSETEPTDAVQPESEAAPSVEEILAEADGASDADA